MQKQQKSSNLNEKNPIFLDQSMHKKNSLIFFYIIWAGDFISTIGTGLSAFSLGVYAFKMTGQATSTSMVVLCAFLPAFFLRPIGGVLADRMDRLLLIICGNLGSALGISFIFFAMAAKVHSLAIIYFGTAFSSIFFAFQNPAFKASVSDFLTEQYYAKASGLMQLSNASQFLVSPMLGGILMSLVNIRTVLFLDILTFIASIIAVLSVRLFFKVKLISAKREKREKFLVELTNGFKIIIQNRGIFILISLISLILFCVGLFQTLLTPLVLSFTTEMQLGLGQSACGIGMLLTSLIISVTQRKKKNTLILSFSLAIMGIFFSLTGITPSIWSVIIPGFIFFLMIPYINSSIDVLIRKNINKSDQGKVWSLVSMITYLGAIAAYASAGFLADKVFDPLFMPNGALAKSLGHIFGVGKGRGISFMFFISGIIIVFTSYLVYKSTLIWKLDNETNRSEPTEELALGNEHYET